MNIVRRAMIGAIVVASFAGAAFAQQPSGTPIKVGSTLASTNRSPISRALSTSSSSPSTRSIF